MTATEKAAFESLFDAIEAKGDAECKIMLLVANLREMGTPWSLIGEALGTTRQAAQQRYGRHERAS